MWGETQDIILCNGDSNFSAVLDCNYVTFDEDTGSTFVGACFYNCVNKKINGDIIYHALPKEPNKLVNSSVCCRFNIERDCSVVSVKMALALLFSHTISAMLSVQMVTRTIGSFLSLALFLSLSFACLLWSLISM